MSFEDDMIEDGFNDEMDYLEYIMDLDDKRRERISSWYNKYECYESEYHPSPIDEDRIIICRGNKYGVVSTNYETIIKCIFDDITADGSYFTCFLNNEGYYKQYCNLNRDGRLYEFVDNVEYSCPQKYDYGIQKWYNHMNYYLVSLNNKYGCVVWDKESLTFIELIPCFYEQVDIVEDSRTGVVSFVAFSINGLWGLYHIKRRDILKAKYNIIQVSNGYISVQVNDKFDILDFTYSTLRQNFSDVPLEFSENRSPIKRDGKYGYVNSNLDVVIFPQYDKVYPFERGIAKVCLNNKFGIIDNEGNSIVEIIYDDIDHHYKYSWLFKKTVYFDFIRVKNNGYWGLLDRSGKIIVNLNYKNISINAQYGYYAADKAMISLEGKLLIPYPDYGFSDKIDNECSAKLDPNEYMWVSPFFPKETGGVKQNLYNQLSLIKSWNGKMGAINRVGDFVIPCEYTSLKACDLECSRIIIAQINNQYGCLNTDGVIILPFGTHSISYDNRVRDGKPLFVDGIQVCNFSSKGFYIGDNVYTDLICCLSSGFEKIYNVKKDGKWGAIKTDGTILVDFRYDEIRESKFGLAAVRLGNKWGFVDETYTEVVVPQYDKVSDFKSLGITDYSYFIKTANWKISPNIGFIQDDFDGYIFESDEISANLQDALDNNKKDEIEYWSKKLDEQLDIENCVPCYTYEYENYLKNLFIKQEKALAVSIVSNNGKKGVINRCGEILVKCIYKDISIRHYYNSIFDIKPYGLKAFKGAHFHLTYNGQCEVYPYCFPKKYHAVKRTKYNNIYFAIINSKVGLVNSDGHTILPCRYKQIKFIKGKKVILFTLKGQRIIQLK